MNILSFFSYVEEEEKEDGDYWQFADRTEEQLRNDINDGVEYYNITDVVSRIQNKELKEKMKENVKKLFYINKETNYLKNSIFTLDEIKELIGSVIDETIHSKSRRDSVIWLNRVDFIDVDFLVLMYTKIYKSSEIWNSTDSNDKKENFNLIMQISNNRARDILLNEYQEVVPKEYKKFLEIKNDEHYVRRKADGYKGVAIGIDSRMKIGAEIEANSDYPGISFKSEKQRDIGTYISKPEVTIPVRNRGYNSNISRYTRRNCNI